MTTIPEREDATRAPTYTVWFWIGLVVAVPFIAYGFSGVLDFRPAALTSFVVYFTGGALLHDLVVAPAVCIIGWIIVRLVPPPATAPVQAALVASGIIGLVAWPFVRGYGITAGEPSFLSRNYTASVLIAWAVIWVMAGLWTAVRVVSARRR